MTTTTTTAADGSQGHGKSSSTDTEQRLQGMGDRLKQVMASGIGADREQVLAKVAELRALASELEDFAESLSSGSAATKPVFVNSTFPRSTRKTMNVVKMPRLGTVFADASGEEGGEFSTQVAIPPGGLTFIASAAVMQESDDDDSVSASVDIADIADAMRGTALESSDDVPMPSHTDDGPAAVAHAETSTESVGGFAHPPDSFAQTILAQATQAARIVEGSAAAAGAAVVAPQMPVPADHTPAAGELPPSGFDVYGMASWPQSATPVSASAIDGSAASATAMPSLPGMYGALPLPYPLPHPLAMHCGFLPPLMYGVPPSMGSPVAPGGAAPPPPPGLGPTTSAHSLAGVPPSSATSSEALAAAQQQALEQQSELWMSEHGVVDANGVPRSKMVMAMPGTDHYQHAVAAAAAAAAAGYPMNVPFMYPHIDSSNISAAATGGGSENNESVVSVDSLSNRGVASRFASVHYPQQPLAGDSARGFNMSGGGEYPPVTQYMWPEHSKHMAAAQGAYPYIHHQQQQGYHQGSGGAGQQGYRRRGSGSNNSSGSGSANGSNANNNNNNNSSGGSNSGNNYHHNQHQQHHQQHHQSRDRRGNTGGGYQRQQRWNNNNNNSGGQGGYNSRHHHHHQHPQHRHQSPHNNSTYSQDAGAPGFSGVAPSEVSIGSSNSGYYSNNNNNLQK
ncbi:hypothetical protein GGI19_000070 [Coemansia pectinata]|uniref:Uncharacterized protein n=1 Tax=Coemansia pectinata TaxID=1052879 RepID=A0A9W8LER1_9FUNG|nr:hypothetical protein GGI19_000070 [Coemansia pectinata]